MERSEFIRRLFERAHAADPEAQCEAYFSQSSEFEAEQRQGELVNYSVSEGGGLGLRVLTKGKLGYASTQILDEEAVGQLVDGAMENAALVESEDEQFIFPGSAQYPEVDPWNPAPEALDAAEKLRMARTLEALTLAQDPRIDQASGSVFYYGEALGLANTHGLNLSLRRNLLGGYVEAVAREGDRVNTGGKLFYAARREDLDLEAAAKAAAREALAGLAGAPVPSGGYRVLLRNDMARTLLATFSGMFSADSAQRGLSRLQGREGEVIAAPCVTLLDDPHLPGSAASAPFDGEGVATRKKAVVEAGRLNTLLHNLKTAAKQGVETTANAARGGYGGPVGVAPSNFYIAPGGDDFEAMLARTGDGLLITELQGMHAGANPITGDFSLAAKGFRVQGGRIAGPVAQITVAGNFYDVLKDVEAVGADLDFSLPFGTSYGSPSLLVKKLSVAGE